MMDKQFLKDRIARTKAMIVAYEDAIDAIVVQGIESYQLDTGQTVQRVTKQNLSDLQKALDALYNRCATLEARCTGSNTIIMRPGF